MNPAEDQEQRGYHRLGFEARLKLTHLDDQLIDRPADLRISIRSELRMLHWLQLDNQYVFVRDSALRSKPALSPLIRLMDAKLNFLAGELFSRHALDTPKQRIDMSATGISFEWIDTLAPGSLWLITVDADDIEAPLQLPAIVQRVGDDADPDSGSRPVAMEFFALSEEETDALASWIVARQAHELIRRKNAGDAHRDD